MTRPIDADAVYKWYLEAFKGQIKPNEIRFSMNDIRDNLENIPTIDAEPVRHGKWVFNPSDAFEAMFAKPKCSECGFESADGGNYCSNCGARMDKDA